MPQTVLILISALDPTRAAAARRLITDLREAVYGKGHAQGTHPPIIAAIPGLHFASLMVFEDERFDPTLTVELNFDGPVGPFLPRLETPLLSPILRAILRCCKPPEDGRRALFDAVTTPGATVPLTPYLETLIVRPAVFHQGNRGLDRARIVQEATLYDSVQTALERPPLRNSRDARSLHQGLRAQMLTAHPWLSKTVADRIAAGERVADFARLAGLVLAVLVALLAPGFVLWLLAPPLGALLVWLAVIAALAGAARHFGGPQPAQRPAPPRTQQLPPEAPAVTPPIIAATIIGLLSIAGCVAWPWLRAAVAGLVLIVAAAILRLRRLEATDQVHEKPRTDPAQLARIMTLEDQVSQNHMGSAVHVKPGVLRAVLIRLGLHGLGLLLRCVATNGYLADMRTIHFAHWALIDNGSRLLFFSNFDSSWESYLDDFIEKAHAGLTLAWSNGIGFPRTRFLVEEGATNGPLFKEWARHSMAESLFWVSAYPELSVNQIERNCAIATGLRATSLSKEAAEEWAALL